MNRYHYHFKNEKSCMNFNAFIYVQNNSNLKDKLLWITWLISELNEARSKYYVQFHFCRNSFNAWSALSNVDKGAEIEYKLRLWC